MWGRASGWRPDPLPSGCRTDSAPIVMLGAGTGLAPFRGFVREFRAEGAARTQTELFFGCRRHDEDFIYKDELLDALRGDPPALRELHTAFSREQAEKVYVQHILRDKAAKVRPMLQQGAYVYVCGALAMGASIREEMAALLGGEEALQRLAKDGRYLEELW